MPADPMTERDMVRHLLATMTYRAARATQHASSEFASFRAHEGSRTPAQILSHIGDLCDWALSLAQGRGQWRDSIPQTWDLELARFHSSVKALDEYLAGSSEISCSLKRLVQGPLADAVSHVGQIAMLRRMSGNPIRGENFFIADIEIGRVGANQPAPRRQFD